MFLNHRQLPLITVAIERAPENSALTTSCRFLPQLEIRKHRHKNQTKCKETDQLLLKYCPVDQCAKSILPFIGKKVSHIFFCVFEADHFVQQMCHDRDCNECENGSKSERITEKVSKSSYYLTNYLLVSN